MDRSIGAPFPTRLALVLGALIVALLVSGACLLRAQQTHDERDVEDRLLTIAQLKAGEISAWRAERRADAAVTMERQALRESVRLFLATGAEAEAAETLRRLRSLKAGYEYADLLVVDPDRRVRLSLSGRTGPPRGIDAPLDSALATGRPVWSALQRDSSDAYPALSLVAPLIDQDTGTPFAALILVSDARQFLYRALAWPTSSRTAEILLVQREGTDVLYLSELRHQPDAALKLRLPLTRARLPAAMAASGRRGIVRGQDYREQEVVAALQPVLGSPWSVVAKIDEKEALAEGRGRSLLILAVILGAAGLVLVTGLVLWQRSLRIGLQARLQAESDLRRAMERHSIVLQAIGDAVISTGVDGSVELMNAVAEQLTGWRLAEARGRPVGEIFRIVNEQTREPAPSPVARVLAEGCIVGLANHTLLLARDGTEVPIADSGAPILDDQGTISGVVLVFRDQTEERLARRLSDTRLDLITFAAHHSLDELLTHALDDVSGFVHSPIAFYHLLDSLGRRFVLSAWSSRTRADFCRAEDQVPHAEVEWAGVWADCVTTRAPVIHNDYAALPRRRGLPQGHPRVLRELVVPVVRDDRVVAVLGVGNKATDYTAKDVELVSYLADVIWEIVQQRRSTEALIESERRYRELFENSRDGLVFVDASGGFISANQAYCDMLGYALGELKQKTDFYEVTPARWREWERTEIWEQRLLTVGYSGIYEKEYIRKDGTVFPVELQSYAVFDAAGAPRYLWGIARDITARHRAEQELHAYQQELEKLVEQRTVDLRSAIQDLEGFAYSVSHDLRAPLRAISGFTRILLDDHAAQLDDEARRLGEIIERNTAKMGRLINDLLAFSRLGREAMSFSEIDMRMLAGTCFDEIVSPQDRERVRFTLGDLPPAIADPRMVRLVWTNLLDNALKFSRNLERPIIDVTARQEENQTVYCVQDNGAGFDMEYSEKLFGVFQRLHSEQEFEGTGVGLALVQRIVLRHGGRVWAQGEVGEGAAFHFALPRTEQPDRDARRPL